MTLRFIALYIIAVVALSSCGRSNEASSEQTPQTTVEAAPTDAIVELTGNSEITPDPQLPIVIDFNAVWCGPCQRFAPTFKAVASELKDKAIFMSVNVDNSPVAAQQFDVSAIPQVSILMPDGTVTSTIGYMEKYEFMKFLDPILQ